MEKWNKNYHKEVQLILELSGIFSFPFLPKIRIKFIIPVAKFHTDNPEFGLILKLLCCFCIIGYKNKVF